MASNIDETKPVQGSALTSAVRANFGYAKDEINDLLKISDNSVTATGTADAIAIAYTPVETAYATGRSYGFVAANDNTSSTTVDINTVGVKNIMVGGAACIGGEIRSGQFYIIRYDGTDFELLNPTPFTRTTVVTATDLTWTPTGNPKSIQFIATGGGGAGGGVDGQAGNTCAISGAGGAGATAIITTNTIDASYAITIGAGGTGVSGNNDGNDGEDTTVVLSGGTITGGKGYGGSGDLGSTSSAHTAGAVGGEATGGDINAGGGDGGNGATIGIGGTAYLTPIPCGGASYWGGGGRGINGNTGQSSTAYGSGGGGTGEWLGADNHAGGDGADGVVIVNEYY